MDAYSRIAWERFSWVFGACKIVVGISSGPNGHTNTPRMACYALIITQTTTNTNLIFKFFTFDFVFGCYCRLLFRVYEYMCSVYRVVVVDCAVPSHARTRTRTHASTKLSVRGHKLTKQTSNKKCTTEIASFRVRQKRRARVHFESCGFSLSFDPLSQIRYWAFECSDEADFWLLLHALIVHSL